MKRATYWISDEDRQALEAIKKRHGFASLSDAIRYAIRGINQREMQPTKKQRKAG